MGVLEHPEHPPGFAPGGKAERREVLTIQQCRLLHVLLLAQGQALVVSVLLYNMCAHNYHCSVNVAVWMLQKKIIEWED